MDPQKAKQETDSLLRAIDEAYDRKSWHGPNLSNSLRGVRSAEAAWRPSPERHNIWEIVLHLAYWKYVVRRRITGLKRGSFQISPGNDWFQRPEVNSERAWKNDIVVLQEEHKLLREAVWTLDLSIADEKTLWLIRGTAAHDFYHAGQIQLLKRFHRS